MSGHIQYRLESQVENCDFLICLAMLMAAILKKGTEECMHYTFIQVCIIEAQS